MEVWFHLLELVFNVIFELIYFFLLLFDVSRVLLSELYYLFLVVYDCEVRAFCFFIILAHLLLHLC